MSEQISIRLDSRLLQRLASAARRRRMRRSDLVREALHRFLEEESRHRSDRPYDRIRDLVGSLSGGPADLGARHRERLAELFDDRR